MSQISDARKAQAVVVLNIPAFAVGSFFAFCDGRFPTCIFVCLSDFLRAIYANQRSSVAVGMGTYCAQTSDMFNYTYLTPFQGRAQLFR